IAPSSPSAFALLRHARRRARTAAESRHFDDFPPKQYMDDLKTPPAQTRAPEQFPHLRGRCVCGHIKVLRSQPKQQIAHRAADDKSAIAGTRERLGQLSRMTGKPRRIDLMCLNWNDDGGRDWLGR